MRLTLTLACGLIALALTGCASKAPARLQLQLTAGDRAHAQDPARPSFAALPPPATADAPAACRGAALAAATAEREALRQLVIKPLMLFSTDQEVTVATERQRADAVVAKVDAFNAAVAKVKR